MKAIGDVIRLHVLEGHAQDLERIARDIDRPDAERDEAAFEALCVRVRMSQIEGGVA